MTKEEYLKKCGAKTSKELTADQILSYFTEGYGGIRNEASAMDIKTGRLRGFRLDRAKGIAMLRQAFDENKILEIHYIFGEGQGTTHYTMKFRENKTF